MGYKIPLTITRTADVDTIKAIPGVAIEESELNYTSAFIWDFIRDKPSVPILEIDPNLPLTVICVLIARLSRYYKVVTLGDLVIASTFVEFSVGQRV